MKKIYLRNLGIIIYFILFKEYPYKRKREIDLIKEINSGKALKLSDNKNLKELLSKMLKRYKWENKLERIF